MGGTSMTTLSIENNHHHPSTLLSMDPTGAATTTTTTTTNTSSSSHEDSDRELMMALLRPPDINLPLSAEHSPPPPLQHPWNPADILEMGPEMGPVGPESYDHVIIPNKAGARKYAKRGDSIWGAWFFFNFYFKPVLSDKSKAKIVWDGNSFSGFDKTDLKLDVFLVQHDMENLYMWVFKERPENALGKMQLRSYMNGHSRRGEPQFPFSADKGFVRSHRMQRKQYRGLSNPQCVHGIEVMRLPNLTVVTDVDRKKWIELTGRDLNFQIPTEASDFTVWRNLPSTEFELERPTPPTHLKSMAVHPPPWKLLNGSGLNLSTAIPSSNHSNGDGMDLSPSSKRRKNFFPHAMEEDQEMEIHPVEPSWLHDFSGVMRHAYGPVTAAKTIYEDVEGYLIMVSLPISDRQRVKVSWRNNLTHGIVKIVVVSTARMPYIKRHGRTLKLTDSSPEHCPPGEFTREIPLATRIPEDANLEAYYDETGTVLEIMVPKHRVGPEEHEVHVCMHPPHLGGNELLLT